MMLRHDAPTTGVLDGEGEIVGIVTRESVCRGLLFLARSGIQASIPERPVRLVMEDPGPVVTPEAELFVLFDLLADSSYVLVDTSNGHEVITDVGLHQYLYDEFEAFLLIEEIERTIRKLIHQRFSEDIEDALLETFEEMDIRTPERIDQCSFIHYQVFISSHWEHFEGSVPDNVSFVRELISEVGSVRNDLFHFRESDGNHAIDPSYLRFAKEYLLATL